MQQDNSNIEDMIEMDFCPETAEELFVKVCDEVMGIILINIIVYKVTKGA